jgi:hypothetical protein
MGRTSLWIVSALAIAGCSNKSAKHDVDAATSDAAAVGDAAKADATPIDGSMVTTQTMTIGASGGSISVDGATLSVPAGAVSTAVAITITKTAEAAPFGSSPSAIYLLLPAGQTFAVPVTITLHLSSPPASGYVVEWSKIGVANPMTALDYETRVVTVAGADVSATNTHFSKVFGAVVAVGLN